ncbi:MAG: hypothetical protein HYY40_12385, partial [Bacteroidetes bacterium]|nr:hypothetical protein [Bacteroidota bacterium]
MLTSFFPPWGGERGAAQECGYIYVAPNGAVSGAAGTKSNPASFSYGLSLVSSVNNYIRMASGTYTLSNTLNIPSLVTIEGGFNSGTWIKSNATPTILHRDTNNSVPMPNRLIALAAINASGFRLLDITITMDNAGGSGTSAYGIYLSGCSGYIISRCAIYAGDATDGITGSPGVNGISGAAAQNGQSGDEEGDCCKQGGAGGSGAFAGSFPGGAGGAGADWGYFDIDTIFGYCYADEFETNDGNNGTNGTGIGLGIGGKGGMGLCDLQYENTNCVAQVTNHGEKGDDGADGIKGFNGTQGAALYSSGFYVPGTGSTGLPGTHGAGGGGGGGGGAKGCEPALMDPQTCDTFYVNNGSGGGGGGGGEGGEGAYGGQGGYGGGGSFAIFIWNNGLNGVIRDCDLNSGNPGDGGDGGPGGIGGSGGAGGQGGYTGENGCCNSC